MSQNSEQAGGWDEGDSAVEEELLAEELGKSGARGLYADTSVLVARGLPLDVYQTTLALPHDLATVSERCRCAMSTGKARIVGDWPTPSGRVIRGVVHTASTMLVIRPAIVTVWLAAADDGSTQVTIRAAAKEGLRKAHAAQRSAEHVLHALGAGASGGRPMSLP